ncbi:MAG: hypothetical protein GY820_00220 [Gammaproteobacteria bacterium]|nr:hypothetical protein [Gammaproteobacteria bacterium]
MKPYLLTALLIITGNANGSLTNYDYDSKANGDQLAYSYDLAGNRTSLTLTPNGGTATTTTFGFDVLNRLTQLTAADINSITLADYQYTLDASGRVTDYIYDDLYRLTDETITDAINGNYSASYIYDNVTSYDYDEVTGIYSAKANRTSLDLTRARSSAVL